jgi:hypothetical protein
MPSPIVWRFSAEGLSELEAAFRSVSAAAAASARATTKSHKRTGEAAKKAGEETKRSGEAGKRIAEKEAATRTRLARMRVRGEIRAERERVREMQRASRQIIREEEKRAKAAERASKRIAASRARGMGRMARGAAGVGIRAVGAVGALATGVTGAAVRESINLQDLATKIAVQGRQAGQEAVAPTGLRKGFEEAALAVPGAKAVGVAEAVSEFVRKTGDLKTALSVQKEIAAVMVATGAEGKDLGVTMADLQEKFKVKSVDGFRDAMAALIFQGKKGSFELADAAKNFAKIGAAAERFGGLEGAGFRYSRMRAKLSRATYRTS